MSDRREVQWTIEKLKVEKVHGDYEIEMSEFDSCLFSLFKRNNYQRVLDLGCGKGKNSLILAKNHQRVFAVDASLESLEKAKDKSIQENIGNIKFYNDSFTNLRFQDGGFDAVLCKSTLHHGTLKEIKQGIREVYLVLKQGGCFAFDMLSKEDESYGKGALIEPHTFVGSREGEKGVLHHYTDIKELKEVLTGFSSVEISTKLYIISVNGGKELTSKVYNIIAFK